ncbi:Pentatricopeptide repeat-containing protein [Nymphaea thermarum]|nr:Pentatricopeptide repeat-containing protein [Nymphaea thermarum]
MLCERLTYLSDVHCPRSAGIGPLKALPERSMEPSAVSEGRVQHPLRLRHGVGEVIPVTLHPVHTIPDQPQGEASPSVHRSPDALQAGEGNVGFQGQGGQRAGQVVIEVAVRHVVGVAGAVPKGRRLDHFVLKALALIVANPLRAYANVMSTMKYVPLYAWSGPFDQALVLYRKMIYNGVSPNKFTFPFVLKACSGLSAVEDGRRIHDDAVRAGLESDVFVATALIDMYSKCGCLDSAYQVFEKMSQRDVVVWNSMAAGCALHGLYDDVICLVLEMQQAGLKPNSSTLVSVLPVFGEASALRQGKSIHSYCVRRCFHLADVLVNAALPFVCKV